MTPTTTAHFNVFLYGARFIAITDHAALQHPKKQRDNNSRLMRWSLKLAEYDYDVLHKPGKLHVDADALSRLPSAWVQEKHSTEHVSTAALINISTITKPNAAPTVTMEVIQAATAN